MRPLNTSSDRSAAAAAAAAPPQSTRGGVGIRFITIVGLLVCATMVNSFSIPTTTTTTSISTSSSIRHQAKLISAATIKLSTTTTTRLYQEPTPEYSREIILREEAESPFRKIRFFTYGSLGAAAATSLLISSTRVIAGLNGINPELLQESSINCLVDLTGIVVLSLAWQRDLTAQNSRLKRAAKGAELSKLNVQVSKSIVETDYDSRDTAAMANTKQQQRFTTSLASLRRGRGMEKRVVIAVGNTERIQSVVQEAIRMNDALNDSDLLIVPVVIEPPNGKIVPLTTTKRSNDDTTGTLILPDCIALPVTTTTRTTTSSTSSVGGNWNMIIADEMEEAMKQDISIYTEGFCIVLKKNGRVGQRTRGIYLSNMVGDVTQRRDAGMDVRNI